MDRLFNWKLSDVGVLFELDYQTNYEINFKDISNSLANNLNKNLTHNGDDMSAIEYDDYFLLVFYYEEDNAIIFSVENKEDVEVNMSFLNSSMFSDFNRIFEYIFTYIKDILNINIESISLVFSFFEIANSVDKYLTYIFKDSASNIFPFDNNNDNFGYVSTKSYSTLKEVDLIEYTNVSLKKRMKVSFDEVDTDELTDEDNLKDVFESSYRIESKESDFNKLIVCFEEKLKKRIIDYAR